MTNERLNAAVEGLLSDRRLLRRFRRNPERALARYELTAEEVVAVRRGDAAELLRLGLDPRYVWPRAHAFTGWSWLLQNAKRLSPAVVLAAVLLPAAPAAARGRRGRSRSVVGRVSRYFAHRGVEA